MTFDPIIEPPNAAAMHATTTEIRPPQPDEAQVHLTPAIPCDPDLRFVDPIVQQCVEVWRQRQDMVRAQMRLTLQAKAICRRFVGGDLKQADALFRAIEGDTAHPMADAARFAVVHLVAAREPLDKARAALERQMEKLGRQLPIAHMADTIRGIGPLALAKVAAECGDLSAYRSVAAVWKRAGLAVIDGQRQRRVAGADAELHGYSPSRRSTFWNMADGLLKAQGKDEAAGPYRQVYDRVKALELTRVESAAHAHNRALRRMTKELLKDLTIEWRRVARDAAQVAA